ncbi:MAG: NifU family protein [Proteobacteria bacterium]|nr:NifU family protein [Pseudomonadota bacterium]
MFIQTEQTPNPQTLKFLPGRPVLGKGVAEFHSYEDAMPSPLGRCLFGLEGVASVFFGADFISVTKVPGKDWSLLKTGIMAAIMDHYLSGMPVIDCSEEGVRAVSDNAAAGGEDNEATLQIKEILETRVRPAVAQDGGDISFVRFEDGVVYLRMQGACAGCPSSTMTLKNGVENLLRHYVPEVRSVEAV